MRGPMEFYDCDENRLISGEFRPVRALDSEAEQGYFESFGCAHKLA
jgi:hypothetical protein